MKKLILSYGKICSGKSTYTKTIKEKKNAVILSVDEITLMLFGQHLGDKHDEICEKTENTCLKKLLK